MVKHQSLNQRTLEVLDGLADARTEFTFPQLRRKLGISSKNSNELTALWNFWRSLMDVQAIVELPSSRKRNRIYTISSKAKLQLFKPTAEPVILGPSSDKVAELEERVAELERRLSLMRNIFAGT